MKKIFAIVAGDPVSINSEIIAKVWKKLDSKKKSFFLIGNYDLFKFQLNKLKIDIPLNKLGFDLNNHNYKKLNILDIPINSTNINKKTLNKSTKLSLDVAHMFSKKKLISGFINCPVNKMNMNFKNMGVTEYLAKKCNSYGKEAMVLYGDKFSVSPITTHIPVKLVDRSITKKKIIKKIITINEYYGRFFRKKPKIIVLGLNPHNGELLKTSQERINIIPAIRYLKKKKLKISGPVPADTVLVDKRDFDIIVGMYHDQVLPMFKAIHKFDAVNITFGLEYLRMSPDHGTAEKLIYKNKANTQSLMKCIRLFNKLNDQI